MTDHTHPQEGINKTSSYLDLSIIYGNNQVEQISVRLLDGTGRLHPDTFADSRLLRMPPSTPAMCVLFSRNHNHIAAKLLAVNERRSWTTKVGELDGAARKKQDEEIFQTARLINCGWFMNVILSDYLVCPTKRVSFYSVFADVGHSLPSWGLSGRETRGRSTRSSFSGPRITRSPKRVRGTWLPLRWASFPDRFTRTDSNNHIVRSDVSLPCHCLDS